MEYITSNKGGRKLAFENNISIKQKVLSNGKVWGGYNGGILSRGILSRGILSQGDFVQGDFVQGDFVQGDFVPGDFVQGNFVRGILSGGVLSGGEFCPRTIINRCYGCKRFQAVAHVHPPVGNLPKDRTEGSVPFQVIGVDFAGPIAYRTKGNKDGKTYIILFTCSLTRAVYLELLPNPTMEEFI